MDESTCEHQCLAAHGRRCMAMHDHPLNACGLPERVGAQGHDRLPATLAHRPSPRWRPATPPREHRAREPDSGVAPRRAAIPDEWRAVAHPMSSKSWRAASSSKQLTSSSHEATVASSSLHFKCSEQQQLSGQQHEGAAIDPRKQLQVATSEPCRQPRGARPASPAGSRVGRGQQTCESLLRRAVATSEGLARAAVCVAGGGLAWVVGAWCVRGRRTGSGAVQGPPCGQV
ncbi:hypothetical protein Dimus_028626, partial [Dionaea muscipula]